MGQEEKYKKHNSVWEGKQENAQKGLMKLYAMIYPVQLRFESVSGVRTSKLVMLVLNDSVFAPV
jgi:hypothetical protein